MKVAKNILFCVLNWGLGHASRSIPLIRCLSEQGAKVVLASDGRALALLRKEFPQLESVELPAYNVSYQSENMFWNIGTQLPKIGKAIRAENRFIQQLVQEKKIDAIISDNRFGCYASGVKSVFITHQIRIKIGLPIIESMVQKVNQYFIQKFDECWIPDFEGIPNLAALLSQQHDLKAVKYLGCLSRMKRYETGQKQDLIVILSGPEPQRTYLEKAIIKQVQTAAFSSLIVQGIPDFFQEKQLLPNCKMISFLTSDALNTAILESNFVLCRSGYSSLMDLVQLQKQAILIPTPGQTEQEYLIQHFKDNPLFVGQKQNDLNIEKGMEILQEKRGKEGMNFPKSGYKNVVVEWLEGI